MKGLIAQKLGPNRDLMHLDFFTSIFYLTSPTTPPTQNLSHLMLLSLVVCFSTQKGLDWPFLVHVLILALISESKGMEYGEPPDQGVWFVT